MQKKKLCGLFLAVVLLLGGCGSSETTSGNPGSDTEYTVLSVLFHEPFLDSCGISVHYGSERKKLIKEIENVLSEEPVFVTNQDGGWFGKDYYALTANQYGIYYYGKVKDNKPDGFGVLSHGEIDLNQLNTIQGIMYAGNFSKGRFDGYGAQFNETYRSQEQDVDSLIGAGKLDESYRELAEVYLHSYVIYDGQWKKGEMNGKGNAFTSMADRSNPVREGYWGGSCYPTKLFVTTVKDDKCSDTTQEYQYGFLIYDGEMKKNYRHGEGVSYYYSGQKKYDGQWSYDNYHGSGKLYDENGELVYSGKWKDGDYAS